MARSLAVAVLTVLSVLVSFSSSSAAEDPLKTLPLAIICEGDAGRTVAYLNNVAKDGTATYLSTDNRQGAKVTPGGTVEPLPTMRPAACYGQSIEQLREKKLTIEMPKQGAAAQ